MAGSPYTITSPKILGEPEDYAAVLNGAQLKNPRAEYKQAWQKVDDKQSALELLNKHSEELGKEIERLKEKSSHLNKQLQPIIAKLSTKYPDLKEAQKRVINDEKNLLPDADVKDFAHKIIYETALDNIKVDLSALQGVKQKLDKGDDEEIRATLKKQSENVTRMLDGNLFNQRINDIYDQTRPETAGRFKLLDLILATGEEFAIDRSNRQDRANNLAKIPREIRRAKWKFMLSVADNIFGMHIDHFGGGNSNPNHLIMIASYYSRLSDHGRAMDNATIAESFKLRHNPAIHSLHTVALADKIFDNVAQRLNDDRSLRHRKEHLAALGKMRHTIYDFAIVHDMGEGDGELSQGIIQAHIANATLKKHMKVLRDEIERATFERHLDDRRRIVFHVDAKGAPTEEPMNEAEWKQFRKIYTDTYHRAEDRTAFLGCLHKTLECMQSQQDYLRFQDKAGADALASTDVKNKEFSLNYVTKTFYDSNNWRSLNEGDNSLKKMAWDGDPIASKLHAMLAEETEKELMYLMSKNVRSYYPNDAGAIGIVSALRRARLGNIQVG